MDSIMDSSIAQFASSINQAVYGFYTTKTIGNWQGEARSAVSACPCGVPHTAHRTTSSANVFSCTVIPTVLYVPKLAASVFTVQ